MIRLHAVVEGQAEETFVKDVLAPELGARRVFIDAHMITTGRKRARAFRGGLTSYNQLKGHLVLWMKQDQHPSCWFTTLIDLYRLPDDFPGFAACRVNVDPIRRAECLEERLANDISHSRFIPYLQVCEFEALLFSDAKKFEIAFPGRAAVIEQMIGIRRGFQSPEHIDDRPDMSPASRILKLVPDYRKAVAGPLITEHIGLATMRKECLHFGAWMQRIDGLGES